jgi:hypothetical protein
MKKIAITQQIRDIMAEFGRRGGTMTQKGRTKAQRSAAGRNAVLARWARVKKEKAVEP